MVPTEKGWLEHSSDVAPPVGAVAQSLQLYWPLVVFHGLSGYGASAVTWTERVPDSRTVGMLLQ
jgi:hypothetical protein